MASHLDLPANFRPLSVHGFLQKPESRRGLPSKAWERDITILNITLKCTKQLYPKHHHSDCIEQRHTQPQDMVTRKLNGSKIRRRKPH